MLKSLHNPNILCKFALPKGGRGLATRFGMVQKKKDGCLSVQSDENQKNFMPKLLRVSEIVRNFALL